MDSSPRILITGGSGFVGQFLLHALNNEYQVVYTYGSRYLSNVPANVTGIQVNLATGSGLSDLLQQHGPFAAVVNCAALSQPGACEKDAQAARAVNVPTHVINLLKQQAITWPSSSAALIHLSTDQVYDGRKSMWIESDTCSPVNQYGMSKVEAEQYIQAHWPHSFILRSSIIYGQLPPDGLPHTPFLQFMASAIAKRQPTSFFNDQWRNPVYIMDVVRVVSGLLAALTATAAPTLDKATVFNMGGPERLSRVDMARLVASRLGLSDDEVGQVVQSVASASMTLAVRSPADISMDSSALEQHLGMKMTAFADALKECLQADVA